jgi:hypothetical protein
MVVVGGGKWWEGMGWRGVEGLGGRLLFCAGLKV